MTDGDGSREVVVGAVSDCEHRPHRDDVVRVGVNAQAHRDARLSGAALQDRAGDLVAGVAKGAGEGEGGVGGEAEWVLKI